MSIPCRSNKIVKPLTTLALAESCREDKVVHANFSRSLTTAINTLQQ